MGRDDATDRPERITGLPIEDAVEVVVARNDDRDPEAVQSVLEPVAEHGIVTEDALQARLAETSKVVSTPETRAELAGIALADARDAAGDATDLDVVAVRLGDFESRLERIEAEVTELGTELQRLAGRADESGAVYEVARGLRDLTREANRLQGEADQLGVDVEEFERWADDPDARADQLAEDVDGVEHGLDGLADDIDGLAGRAEEGEVPTDGEIGTATDGIVGDESADCGGSDRSRVWVDAAFRHRVLGLLIEDARAEVDDLRRWARREGREEDRLDELAARLRSCETRRGSIGGQLVSLAESEWVERYGERLSAFESALEAIEPPIDWNEVQATIEEHGTRIDAGSADPD